MLLLINSRNKAGADTTVNLAKSSSPGRDVGHDVFGRDGGTGEDNVCPLDSEDPHPGLDLQSVVAVPPVHADDLALVVAYSLGRWWWRRRALRD